MKQKIRIKYFFIRSTYEMKKIVDLVVFEMLRCKNIVTVIFLHVSNTVCP